MKNLGLAVVLLLAACASSEDPGSDSSTSATETADAGATAESSAGDPAQPLEVDEDAPFPSLSGFPETPEPTPPAEREAIVEGLVADRRQTRYAAQAIPLQEPAPNPWPVETASAEAEMVEPIVPPTDENSPQSTLNVAPRVAAAAAAAAASGAVTAANPPPPAELAAGPAATAGVAPRVSAPPASSAAAAPPRVVMGPIPGASAPPSPVVTQPSTRTPAVPPRSYQPPRRDDRMSTVVVSGSGVQVIEQPVMPRQNVTVPDVLLSSVEGARVITTVPPKSKRGTLVATLLFGSGSAAIGGTEQGILRDVAAIYAQRGGRVGIFGHASRRTRTMPLARHQQVNFEISADRARRVARALIDLGVPGDQIDIIPVGDAEPAYFEIMPSGEAGNRRVEIYIDRRVT